MTNSTVNMVLIISIIVIVLFAIVYITLFKMLYSAKGKVIQGKLDDEIILKQIDCDYEKYKKKDLNYSFIDYYNKTKKNKKIVNIVSNVILGIFLVLLGSSLIVSITMRANGDQVKFGDTSFLVIRTSSMASVHKDNDYIVQNNLNNQLYQYSLISIKSDVEIKQFDIAAFKIDNEIIVHRVIEIEERNGKKYYTFQGDANPASLAEEIDVPEENIVGVYSGYQNNFLGHLVIYFQSGIGLISVVVALLVVFAYNYYYSKIENMYQIRYEELMQNKYNDQIIVNEEPDNNIIESNENETEIDNNDLENDEELDDDKLIIRGNLITHFAKLSLANDDLRDKYNQLKNYLLSHKKVKSRFSKKHEVFSSGKNKLVMITIRGKSLIMHINLNPIELDKKYYIVDDSNINKYQDFPSKFKIRSNRSLKFAKELIDILMNNNQISFVKEMNENYLSSIPRLSKEELIEKGEIKIVNKEV